MGKLFRYVSLGDSTAVGVGAAVGGGYPERLYQRLKKAGAPAGILNLGQSGATSGEVLEAQVGKARSVSPDLVTLGIGTNDLWRGTSVTDFATTIDRIADGLARTDAEVVVSNIIDLSAAPIAQVALGWLPIPKEAIFARVAAFNGILSTLAKRPRFTVVDLHAMGSAELKDHPEYFCDDGFHPSEHGYERWAGLLWPSVEAALRRWEQTRGREAQSA